MRTNLNVPVPSKALLNFMRSQSDGLCFFSSNPRGFVFDHAAPRGKQLKAPFTPRKSFAPKRRLSTTAIRPATVEAGILNFDFILPRVAHGESQWSRGSSPKNAGYGRLGADKMLLDGRRNASHDHRPWLRRFWDRKTRRQRPLDVDDMPYSEDGADTSMFNLGRTMAAKAANEPKLRCTEFDENGNVVLVNGEFKKSELIAKVKDYITAPTIRFCKDQADLHLQYGLLPRDLRKIDSSLLPHILVRPSAILINLLHLRCLIKSDRVLVFDAYGTTDSYTQSVFMYDLEGKLRQKQNSPSAGGLPYEFRALEAVLISVTSGLEGEFDGVREPVVRVLRELEEDIDRDKLRHLLIYSKKLGTFEQKAKLVRDAIDELLEADDDLAAMYLTEKANGIIRSEGDHTEVEMLLESYHKVCDEIVQGSGNLVSNIRNTEEM